MSAFLLYFYKGNVSINGTIYLSSRYISAKMEEVRAKFRVVYSEEADRFLQKLPFKIRSKIIFNIQKSRYLIDPELFKKLDNSDIWEFRTLYNKISYRMLAFWDKTTAIDTLVIATHGFIKKVNKVPRAEIVKANRIRQVYFNDKKIEK